MNSGDFRFFLESVVVSVALPASGGTVLPVFFMDGVLVIFSCFTILMWCARALYTGTI
jgi:hypothetical protein